MANKKLPPEVIEHWPEVFEDVEVEVVPVDYLHSVRISFEDGITWDIDLTKDEALVELEESIANLFETYEDAITHIDFRLNTEKVKEDISKRTHLFMKKRR